MAPGRNRGSENRNTPAQKNLLFNVVVRRKRSPIPAPKQAFFSFSTYLSQSEWRSTIRHDIVNNLTVLTGSLELALNNIKKPELVTHIIRPRHCLNKARNRNFFARIKSPRMQSARGVLPDTMIRILKYPKPEDFSISPELIFPHVGPVLVIPEELFLLQHMFLPEISLAFQDRALGKDPPERLDHVLFHISYRFVPDRG